MCDQYHGHVELILQFHEQIQNLRLNGDIQIGSGLIGQHQRRIAKQCPSHADPLFHAAAQFMGKLSDTAFRVGDTYQSQQFCHPIIGGTAGQLIVPHQNLTQLVADTVDGI